MKLDKYLAGDYISAAEVSTGDKIKFLNSGEPNEIQNRVVITFKVLTQKKEERKISPNKTSLRTLAKKWGLDTDEWIGKIATIQKNTENVRGEMKEVLYLLPEGVDKIEKSEMAVNAELADIKEDIPIIGGEIDPPEIPF